MLQKFIIILDRDVILKREEDSQTQKFKQPQDNNMTMPIVTESTD